MEVNYPWALSLCGKMRKEIAQEGKIISHNRLFSEIFYCLFLLVDNYGNCVIKDEHSPWTENKYKT